VGSNGIPWVINKQRTISYLKDGKDWTTPVNNREVHEIAAIGEKVFALAGRRQDGTYSLWKSKKNLTLEPVASVKKRGKKIAVDR